MKTLVTGAVAGLCFAALTLTFAAPAAADDAVPTPSDSSTVPSTSPSPSVPAPTPPASVPPTPPPADVPTPQAPETSSAPVPALPQHAQPVKPPAPPCGSTLDDVVWPSTPGITYSHDEWNAYAHLLPGWEWRNSSFNLITGWWLLGGTSSVEATLVWLPRQMILNPTGSCGATTMAPESTRPDSPCWTGLAHPKPCGVPVHDGSGTPGSATTTVAAQPTTTPPMTATADAAPPATPVVPTAPPATATATPSPAPSPSATPSTRATARVATSTGLGVAGGVAGSCALAVAGAFVLRRRLRPAPGVVVLDEATEQRSAD